MKIPSHEGFFDNPRLFIVSVAISVANKRFQFISVAMLIATWGHPHGPSSTGPLKKSRKNPLFTLAKTRTLMYYL